MTLGEPGGDLDPASESEFSVQKRKIGIVAGREFSVKKGEKEIQGWGMKREESDVFEGGSLSIEENV